MKDPAILIPARTGRAIRAARSAIIDVINTHGTQVVDFWALCPPDLSEYLSMEHTHTSIGWLIPRVGDTLVSSLRRPLLTVIADTSPGNHDTLIASCDAERYRQLGFEGKARQLSRQLRDGTPGPGPAAAAAGAAQHVHERPVDPGWILAVRAADQPPRRPDPLPRRD
jgi:hypothetical protein